MAQIDWKKVTGHGNRHIGAVGFIGNEAVAIVSYYDDRDGNLDGTVTWKEKLVSRIFPIRISGSNLARVAVQAAYDPDLTERDPSLNAQADQLFMGFARQTLVDGVYASYFARPVGMAASGLAAQATGSAIKQFLVKKGAEAAVKAAFQEAMD
ncbi:hypothetical protein [Sphingomonas sp.]|uniref:hypothetical protein n=1 Tax=Sphingomonas sp. TaxID=28214 RepID=UPI0035C7A7C7